ncbi:MAG: hypothetical protein KBC41_00515 [Candidatus Pacebacteria bacterium]|nr:hypothetical protein [Candidatus Paceibacterota bacterium]MBP9866547.1 hypothetical protein [Candidatus Paceibacterota bacterium]
MQKKEVLEVVYRKVLFCVKEQKRTAEEIQNEYIRCYPQGLLAKVLSPPPGVEEIRLKLMYLVKEGFVLKELTNYIREALDKEVEIFWISDKGRSYLLSKK